MCQCIRIFERVCQRVCMLYVTIMRSLLLFVAILKQFDCENTLQTLNRNDPLISRDDVFAINGCYVHRGKYS